MFKNNSQGRWNNKNIVKFIKINSKIIKMKWFKITVWLQEQRKILCLPPFIMTLIFREQNIQTQLYNQDIFEGSGDFNFENIQKTEIVDKTGRLYYWGNCL